MEAKERSTGQWNSGEGVVGMFIDNEWVLRVGWYAALYIYIWEGDWFLWEAFTVQQASCEHLTSSLLQSPWTLRIQHSQRIGKWKTRKCSIFWYKHVAILFWAKLFMLLINRISSFNRMNILLLIKKNLNINRVVL